MESFGETIDCCCISATIGSSQTGFVHMKMFQLSLHCVPWSTVNYMIDCSPYDQHQEEFIISCVWHASTVTASVSSVSVIKYLGFSS